MVWSDKAKSGESGLADEYIFTVRSAKFAFPFENAPTACALVLTGERDIDGNIEDSHMWLNVGAFEPGDAEGTFALHETQEANRYFNKNSKMGKFLKSALEAGVPLEQTQAKDRNQYETKDALMWVGLRLRIEEVETTGKLRSGPDAGKEFTSRQPTVREYLGTAGEGAPGATASQATASGSATAPADGTISEDEAKEIAKGAGSWIKTLEILTEKHGLDPSHEYAQKAWYESVVSG